MPTYCCIALYTDPDDFEGIVDSPVTFFSGDVVGTRKCINITIVNDSDVEFDQDFFAQLSTFDPVIFTPFGGTTVVIEDTDGELWHRSRLEECILYIYYSCSFYN